MADHDVLDDLEQSLNAIDLDELPQRAIEGQLLELAKAGIAAHQTYRRQIREAVNARLDYEEARAICRTTVRSSDVEVRITEGYLEERCIRDETVMGKRRAYELAAGLRDATLEELRTLRDQMSAFQTLLADLRALVGA